MVGRRWLDVLHDLFRAAVIGCCVLGVGLAVYSIAAIAAWAGGSAYEWVTQKFDARPAPATLRLAKYGSGFIMLVLVVIVELRMRPISRFANWMLVKWKYRLRVHDK